KLLESYRAQAKTKGTVAAQQGDAEEALSHSSKRVVAEYDVPYLAHATMEPLNCAVRLGNGRCEIWTGTQFQTMDQMSAARIAGTPFEQLMVKNGVDNVSVEGVVDSPYLESVPARVVTLHSPRLEVPVLWWRSVGNTHTAFAMESMIDELAWATGRDALEYRS